MNECTLFYPFIIKHKEMMRHVMLQFLTFEEIFKLSMSCKTLRAIIDPLSQNDTPSIITGSP